MFNNLPYNNCYCFDYKAINGRIDPRWLVLRSTFLEEFDNSNSI